MSPMIITSESNIAGFCGGYVVTAPPPTSSIPSITTFTPTGGRPPHARSAPTCAMMFDLVSAVPRPKIAPSRSVGSNGGECHSDRSPAGTTS